MAENEEETRQIQRRKNLRKQLAVAVRSLQWSYAIFWCSSPTQHGVLEWGEGYYTGDIKKRKKNNNGEMDDEFKDYCKYELQRSKQLRQLYLLMLEGDTTITTTIYNNDNNNNIGLSPDHLTDEEWYYLVSMSYLFSPGQGLPGTSLATGETIWLCNAQYAENKLFTRSLLARSASIQTVVCFPFSDGVIELGVTDLIAEDQNLLQHVKACLLDTSKPNCFGEGLPIIQNNNSDDDDDHKFWVNEENFQELKERNNRKITRMDCNDLGFEQEDIHYKRTVSAVLHRRKKAQYCSSNLTFSDSGSSFLRWKQCGTSNENRQWHPLHPQNVLRKILYNVPLMHTSNPKRRFDREMIFEQNHEIPSSDRRRENEKFRVLGSMVPTVNEIDKESILNNTIKYLYELEARVEELESCMGSVDFMERQKKTSIDHPSDMIEETSDNYESMNLTEEIRGRDESDSDVRVKVKETEVLIEIKCRYREYIVADIMEAISNLHMDAFSVRSHTLNGFLLLNLKAKFRGHAVSPVGMIKRELKKSCW